MPAFDVDAITLEALSRRTSAKYRMYPPDVIPAWVAEMDFPLAAPIAAALHRAIDDSDTGYPWSSDLADACSAFARAAWGWDIPPERVVVLADVLSCIDEALALMTAPGSGVVITPPVYPPFTEVVEEVAGRRVVAVPLLGGRGEAWRLDLEGLAAAFARPDVSALLLASPHNPTGTVWSAEVLAQVADLAARHDVAVIADEAHAPLVLPGATFTPYLTVAGDDANAVSTISASKAWNLAGLKAAQLVATERTAVTVGSRIPMVATFTTGHLGVIASIAAYREGSAWLADVVDILDGQRRLLADLLAEQLPVVGYVPPEASYLAWLDLSATGLGDDPAAPIIERGRVALSSGIPFGAPGFARLNLATSPAILREIVRRIVGVADGTDRVPVLE